MQCKLLTLSALAASVLAQNNNTSQSAEDLSSVISVLQTALPSSLIQEALTNSAAVSSQIASEFSAGQTPSWFTALPSDVQTYLVPAAANATGSVVSPGSNSTRNSTVLSSRTSTRAPTTITSTATAGSSSTTGSGSGQASGSGSSTDASSSSTGGASLPTNMVGVGLVGAMGLFGVLAL